MVQANENILSLNENIILSLNKETSKELDYALPVDLKNLLMP